MREHFELPQLSTVMSCNKDMNNKTTTMVQPDTEHFMQQSTASSASEQTSNLCEIGLCHSWKEQQKNITTFLQLRSLTSPNIPRLLLAQFDDGSITVYQAYKPSIGLKAAEKGNFLDTGFSFGRMTWFKPNFSWMLHRAGWGTKKNQETILAIKLKRPYFENLLEKSVSTSWEESTISSPKAWSKALRQSDVIVQWDPDHHLLSGYKLPYRVLQVGIRRSALEGFRGSGIISITDITQEVHRIRKEVLSKPIKSSLSCNVSTPLERKYPVSQSLKTVLHLK